MSTVGMAAVSAAACTFSRAKRTACCDYEHCADDEIHRLHHIVEGGHLALEDVYECGGNETSGPRTKQRGEPASVKEA
jgi:hypothetical protein